MSPNMCVPMCGSNFTLSATGYCSGSGATMNMNGFDSLAADGAGDSPCINYLFYSWTLNSNLRVILACIGTLLLGMFIQLITKMRTFLSPQYNVSATAQPRCGVAAIGNRLAGSSSTTKAFLTVALYGTQTILSYLIMLVAMTYNVELFVCVAAGLTLGYAVFLLDLPHPPHSTDPCCSTLDEALSGGSGDPVKKAAGSDGVDDKHGLYSRLIQNSLHGHGSANQTGGNGSSYSKASAPSIDAVENCCGVGAEDDEVSVKIN